MGCYIAPDDSSIIEDIVAAIRKRPHEADILLDGYFNADLVYPEETTGNYEISAALTAAGLEDMSVHFLPRSCNRMRHKDLPIFVPHTVA